MTLNNAKKLMKAELTKNGLNNKVTGKTISFSDLARESMIFIQIHDWKPNPLADTLRQISIKNGFRVTF